ncbi:HAMP domain-containing protein [Myxococcaceae bacterium JPH2]|nr:HAMP domain-containing protein [Myxococcaceae bacterium JPH2]
MTVRTKVLLFAVTAIGLVMGMSALVWLGAHQGRRTRDRALVAQRQAELLLGLRANATHYLHGLADTAIAKQDTTVVRDEALRHAEGDFVRLAQLAREEARASEDTPDEELERFRQLADGYRRWLRETEAGLRAAGPEDLAWRLHAALHVFAREPEPEILQAWEAEQQETAELLEESTLAFDRARWLGGLIPLAALLLVGGLALAIVVPLRRSFRTILEGAERLGHGDFDCLLPENSRDECGALARAFNRMARELRDTLAERQQRVRLEAEAVGREIRSDNARLEQTVRERTTELERANAKLTESLQELQATQSRLLFADRLASVGQLAAGVGHEINNPLAFIIANLQFVAGQLDKVDGGGLSGRQRLELQAALAEAGEGAERVRVIVKELQNLARPDSLDTGPVDLGAVARSAVKMAMHLIRPRAGLVLEVDSVPAVLGNGGRLCQVLLNLLLNAAHAIEPGRVEWNTIRLSAREEDGWVRVEVSDTGCGIATEHLDRIFDPFFTTRPVGTGTGLGLAVCQGIIAAHGGELSVDSEVSRGTTFRVRLRTFAQPSRATGDTRSFTERESLPARRDYERAGLEAEQAS